MKEGKNGLNGLLDILQHDDSLSMEIRDSYIDINYRGVPMYTIEQKASGYEWNYNDDYLVHENKHLGGCFAKTLYKEKIQELHRDKIDIEAIPLLKFEIDRHTPNMQSERECQQWIIRENNRLNSDTSKVKCVANNTDYYIADIEYTPAAVDNKKFGEIDLIAFKWDNHAKPTATIALIELKYGDNAITEKQNKSGKPSPGLSTHLRDVVDFLNYLESKNDLDSFKEEMMLVFNQKLELGLISPVGGKLDKRLKGVDKKIEYIIILANSKPLQRTGRNKEISECMKIETPEFLEVLLAESNHMGYGLYKDRMIRLEEYLS